MTEDPLKAYVRDLEDKLRSIADDSPHQHVKTEVYSWLKLKQQEYQV